MQINEFEIFCMVARLKSFSKAAKLLYMTQPAISSHIQTLENHYGAALFHRHSHGVSLTEVGEVVYQYANRFLDLHDNMEKKINEMINLETQKLVVGASSTIGSYTLPCSIWVFKEKYPSVDISLEIANSATIIRKVEEGEVHLAVVEGSLEQEGLQAAEVFRDEIILITPPKGRWLSCREITLEELSDHPLILREHGSGVRKLWEQLLKDNGFQLSDFNIATEMGSIDAIKSAVEAGKGIAIISRVSVKKEIRRGTLRGVKLKDIASAIKFQIVYRSDQNLPDVAQRFIRFLTVPEERSFC